MQKVLADTHPCVLSCHDYQVRYWVASLQAEVLRSCTAFSGAGLLTACCMPHVQDALEPHISKVSLGLP